MGNFRGNEAAQVSPPLRISACSYNALLITNFIEDHKLSIRVKSEMNP